MQKILSPSELNNLIQQISSSSGLQTLSSQQRASLMQLFEQFMTRWAVSYARFGQNPAGELSYRDNILYFTQQCLPKFRKYLTEHGQDSQAVTAIECMLLPDSVPQKPYKFSLQNFRIQQKLPESFECPVFDRPLFIVSTPRAGSTLLFENLSRFEEIWSIGHESHQLETDITYLHPASHDYESNRLLDAPLEVCEQVRHWFARRLQNRDKHTYLTMTDAPKVIRFLEKTPKNALRIPFLKKVFPNAQFIFLYREPQANISSMLEGWRSNRFLAYQNLPRWPYKEWHFLLPSGWEALADCPLVEIAAFQWCAANQAILHDLQALPKQDWHFVMYQDLVTQPAKTIGKISRFAGLQENTKNLPTNSETLPLSSMVVSPPSQEKWRKHEAEINAILPLVKPVMEQIRLLARSVNHDQ
jgi:hypothetical protein